MPGRRTAAIAGPLAAGRAAAAAAAAPVAAGDAEIAAVATTAAASIEASLARDGKQLARDISAGFRAQLKPQPPPPPPLQDVEAA